MSTLATLNVVLSADVGDFQKGLQSSASAMGRWSDSVESSAKSTSGFFATAFSMVTGGLIIKGIDAVTGSIKGLVGGMIGGNAQFESYNVQFTTMLGSAELAKERLASLAQFGASTPFELPQVVEADKILQGFGLHSLESAQKFGYSGEQILTIAGDVASGTGTDFAEMALNIGKFSQGATGEAIARFMELGVITRDELSKMGVQFSKSGELISPLPQATTAMLQIMEQKYGGLMAAQSTTFNGMMSNMQDFIGNSMRTLGAPIFDVLKGGLATLLGAINSHGPQINAMLTKIGTVLAGFLGSAIDFIANDAIPALVAAWGMIAPAVRGAWQAMQAIGSLFADLGRAAMGWGQNIVNQLAIGIMQAAASVVRALGNIGAIITSWLRPHSPPKLLPDLDKWGADAATVYMDGWTDGDFSAFTDLSSQIQTHLKSISEMGGIDKEGIIPTLLGSRTVIAEMIDSIDRIGSVGQDAFDRLREAAGPAADVAEQLMRGYMDVEQASRAVADAQADLERATQGVADAQEYLNKVTAEYDAQLAPLNAELKQTQDQLAALRDKKKEASLQSIISDTSKSEEEKAQARLELQELHLKQLIDAKEDEKNSAIDVAKVKVAAAEAEEKASQAKLKAAEAVADQAKQQYAATQAMIKIQQDNNSLVAEQVDLLKSLAASAAGASGGGGGGGGIGGLTDSIGGLGDMLGETPAMVNPVNSAFVDMKDRMLLAAEGINNTLNPAISGLQSFFAPLLPLIQPVIDAFNENGISGAIMKVVDAITQVSPVFAILRSIVETSVPLIRDIIMSVFGIVAGFIQTNGADIIAFFTTTWHTVWSVISGVITVIHDIITGVLGAVNQFLQANGGEIQALFTAVWQTIQQVISTAVSLIDAIVKQIFIPLAAWIKENQDTIALFFKIVWEEIRIVVTGILTVIQTFMTGIMTIISGDWSTVWEGIKIVALSIWEGIKSGVDTALTWLKDHIAGTWETIKATWESTWTGIGDFFKGWWDTIKSGVQVAVDFIVTTVTGAWDAISTATANLFSGIGDGISGSFDAVVKTMKGIINGAIRAINTIVNGLNTVSSALGMGNALSPIGELAKGTQNWRGGLSTVSEQGLEFAKLPGIGEGLLMPGMYDLPKGSQVVPAGRTASMMQNNGSSGDTYNITYVRGNEERDDVMGDISMLKMMYGGAA